MTVIKDEKRNTWRARFMANGQIYTRRGFKTKADANRWITEEKKRIAREQKTAITFSSLSEHYLNDCEMRMQTQTVTDKRRTCKLILAYFDGDFPAELITKPEINKYLTWRLDERGAGASNTCLKHLKALYKWGIENEIISTNPFQRVKPYPVDKKEKYIPPQADIDNVKLVCKPDERDIIDTCFYTAGRISEILNLTWDDVNFERKEICLKTRKRKGGGQEYDWLPMVEPLEKIMKRRWEGRPDKRIQYVFYREGGILYTNKYMDAILRWRCKQVGVRKFSFHCIRHYVARVLVDSGKATIRDAQHLLRHRKAQTTSIYLGQPTEDLRGIIQGLDDAVVKGEK